MKSQQVTKFTLRTLPFLISVAFASNAFAQQALEEVVVSAQKRTERIQDVPISITAISGQALENRKIEGAADLQGAAPNLNVVAAPVAGLTSATTIRGLGSGQPSIWADPGVGMYVDGVFVGKSQGSLLDMLDLERVEILRGPQGTLFGRNTTGGAVNFVTRQPSGEFSGSLGLEIGNYGRQVEKVSIDLPKIDNTLSLGFSARREKQDGWLANPNASEKWGNRDREAYKIGAKFDISKDTKFYYSFDHSNINETTTPMSVIKTTGYCSYVAITGCSAGLFTNGLPGYYGPYYGMPSQSANLPSNGSAVAAALQSGVPTSTSSTLPPNQNLGVTGHTWIAETALNANNVVKYIGSYRDQSYRDVGDYDGTAANIFTGIRSTSYQAHSHEVQLIGNTKDINYVGGVYYFKDNGFTVQDQIGSFYTMLNGMATRGQSNFGVNTEAKAIYGQADFKLDEKTTLTPGLRYTNEKKTGSIQRTNSDTGALNNSFYSPSLAYNPTFNSTGSASAEFSSYTPTVALSYKLNPNNMVFARLSKGFKSGGFPLEAKAKADALTPFQPEKSTSYEIGAKGAGGSASYAATAYLAKLDNQQISFLPVGSTSPIITNAGKSTYEGIELEGALKVTADTKIAAGYSYLHAQFDQFMAMGISGQQVDAANNLVVGYAPKHTFNFNTESTWGVTAYGKLKSLVEYRIVSSYYNYNANKSMTAANAIAGNLAADSKMSALGTVNARLTLADVPVGGPGKGDVSLWVKNLTDKQVMQNMMDVSGYYQVGYWSAPRTFGASFNYKW